jgi:hypothetical protein
MEAMQSHFAQFGHDSQNRCQAVVQEKRLFDRLSDLIQHGEPWPGKLERYQAETRILRHVPVAQFSVLFVIAIKSKQKAPTRVAKRSDSV